MKTLYRLCFKIEHVSRGSECTRIPYGAENLYDPGCWPKAIDVSFIRQEAFEDARKAGVDRPSKADRARALQMSLNTPDPQTYEADQWVLVRGKVIGKRGDNHLVQFIRPSDSVDVLLSTKEIVAVTDAPCPVQPNQTSLLASIKSGRIYRWIEASNSHTTRDAGWAHLVNGERISWEELYAKEGPFQEYKTDGEV